MVRDEDEVTFSDKYCLENIVTSTTITRRNISAKNITFMVPFESSSTTRPSTTWMYGSTRIKTSEKFTTSSQMEVQVSRSDMLESGIVEGIPASSMTQHLHS